MLKNNELKVVVGLGKTGLSCVRFLVAKGYKVAVTDSRNEPPGLLELSHHFPDVPVRLGSLDEALLDQATELVVSPGVSIKEPVIAKQFNRKIPIIGDIELFAKYATKPIVAITGSNGKSTVTSLVGHLAINAGLNAKVGGNLGIPALDLLDEDADLYVLELSSFQLETTYSLKCLAAVNLNISPDHLDRYANMQEYINAKLRIYRHCQRPIINLDDPQSYCHFDFKVKPTGFTLTTPPPGSLGLRKIKGETFLAHGEENLLSIQHLPLKGQHQYANALASLALGMAIELPMESMLASLKTFKGLPHRCQWVANIKGVDWYNDSKATNVGSAFAAIMGIGPEINGKLILLAGGQGKNADFSSLSQPVAEYVKTLILYGEDKLLMAKALHKSTEILIVDDLAAAILAASSKANKGDVVLLCPACASYDMFNNFEHRGEVFMQMVRGLTL